MANLNGHEVGNDGYSQEEPVATAPMFYPVRKFASSAEGGRILGGNHQGALLRSFGRARTTLFRESEVQRRPKRRDPMKVRVSDRQRKAKLNLAWIKSLIGRALRFEGRPEAEVSVLLVDDEGIRELNRSYRGLDQPTDCLAFSQREGRDLEINPNLLGDIVVSVETALVQSKTYKQSLKKEISLYLIHGLLHLLGYDDAEPVARARMFRRQEELLQRLERGK